MKLGVLFSGGKDSTYAAYLASKEHELVCLISMKSDNPDSYMFHTPNIDLVLYQAEAMDLPLVIGNTKGEKEVELEDLEETIKKAKEEYNLDGIITGALYSDYQRERIEKIAEKLNLKVISPLWHKNQEKYMRELIENKFEIIFSSVAADGLDKSWLGRIITNEDIDKLVELNKKNGLNIALEGGEAESFVLNCPLFKKRLKILKSRVVEENKSVAKLIIDEVKLN
ncbi:MAG: diphthine--ammonia ligase [Candidatus Woesearchaeota archaeon]